jgi:protein-disulfide isomerase
MIPRRTIFIVAAAWVASGGLALAAASGSKSASASKPAAEDMAMGNPKAKVTVVEYASASCPHCARFNNEVFPAFKKKYVDTGQVRYVFREFLTEPVNVAKAAVLVARCAGPDKYFTVIDEFFRGQAEAYRQGDAGPLLRSAAAKGGLDEARLRACLSDKAANEALEARVERWSTQEGVDSTPTFVINGKKLPSLDHEIVLEDLDAAIQPLLKKGR